MTKMQYIAPAVVVGAVVLGLGPLFWFLLQNGGLHEVNFDARIIGIVWFTLKQAFLSTVISVFLGLAAARGLARRNFCGKSILLNVFAVPQALPAIVAVLGFLSVYGHSGWVPDLVEPYGLMGIVFVHVFFNLPLALRLCLEVLNAIAPENFRLGQQLDFSDAALFRYVEWPALRASLPRIFALIFLLCSASFIVVLTLGGPNATTLEVAIFQALRMDFDVGRAVAISLLQICLSLFLAFSVGQIYADIPRMGVQLAGGRRDDGSLGARLMDVFFITIAGFIVVPPVLAVLIAGLPQLNLGTETLNALGLSLLIGSLAALCAVDLAWSLARMTSNLSISISLLGLIVPPAVMATGWFLFFRNFSGSFLLSFVLVIALNSLMALPFAAALLRDGFNRMGVDHERLCGQLGVNGWTRFRRVDFPLMWPSVVQAMFLAFVFSLGDLTAVILVGSQGLVTLPSLLHQQMGHYRGADAAGTALVLSALCFAVAVLAKRLKVAHD